ncbi:MAG: hypothetical protein JRI79_02410 [Deltaproteobacteria bacterium]|nr:hypothetical protein [Deltaproteobacteria bacterium]MBW1976813.1 hypothetical protein [Deltaproteobacteria bacterium]MBW2299910.1 hypothetical protein [Deltaproteobacteria bacterium]
MEKKRNPIHRKGERNSFCPFYRICLDEAAKKSWDYWDCSECEYRSSREESEDNHNRRDDSFPYYYLPDDIFGKLR